MASVTIDSANEAGPIPAVFWDKGTKGTLIVVHEWWGLTETIKKQATLIADKCNISVLAPDLFRGWMSTEMSEASPHFAAFDWDAAMIDVAAAVNFLKKKGCEKVNFITACKRCCGKVMFFTPVCLFTGGGDWLPSMHHRSHDHHPGGSASMGICLWGVVCIA